MSLVARFACGLQESSRAPGVHVGIYLPLPAIISFLPGVVARWRNGGN